MINDTICAPATAAGGAISIIRISGPEAISIANSIFSRDITSATSHRALYGEIKDEADATTPLDDVLLTVFRSPHSYTGEDSVEVSCHGSRYIVSEILRLLQERGCRMAQPGEFTQRAFLSHRIDLSQAEAVADLIASTNAASHRLAMNQMRGGISNRLEVLRQQLLTLTSLLELELDFSDHEDIEFADRTQLLTITHDVHSHVSNLVDSFRAGSAIKEGIPVAIIGAPNVGKSTLLNALLQEERAIVSDIQGTTRDLIEDTIHFGGHTFRFIDTAGIRHATDEIERIGIQRSLQAAKRAQIIILLTEPDKPLPEVEHHDDQIVIPVVNKCDKLGSTDHFLHTGKNYLTISARCGIAIDELRQVLINAASSLTVSESDLIITNARHHASLAQAAQCLERVEIAMRAGISGDLIAQDLREALHHLADITGKEITSSEVLGNIFSRFCIGK